MISLIVESKNNTNELTYKTEIDLKICENKHMVRIRKEGRRDKVGIWD